MRSTVSVIIPNYNCERWISGTLDSVLRQKEYLKEVIVVDDHSTDKSWDILKKYESNAEGLIRVFKNTGKGGNNARNYGYSLSTGDLIQWLDADDQISEDKFEKQVKAFEENPDIDIMYSDWELDTYKDEILVRKEHKKSRPYGDYLMELLKNNWLPPHAYLLRRSIAETLYREQAWNPATPVMQDREYFTMAAIYRAKFQYVPGSFAIYNRWNELSVSAAKSETRNLSLNKILSRFEDELQKQLPASTNLKKYQDIINTQKLLIRVAGQRSDIQYGKIGLTHTDWSLVHGKRTFIKMITELLKGKVSGRSKRVHS